MDDTLLIKFMFVLKLNLITFLLIIPSATALCNAMQPSLSAATVLESLSKFANS